MKVGDLVIRKDEPDAWWAESKPNHEFGLVLSKQMGGSNPVHPCITVLYPKSGEIYDIAESLMEVISEAR